MNNLSAARKEPNNAGRFDIAPYEQFISKPRKEPNDQIFTFQAKLAVLTLRHMNSLSAAGQAQKGAK